MIRALNLSGCLLAVLAFTGAASAATVMSACSGLSGPTELTDSLLCPTFNNALGTLTSIEIDFTGNISATISLHNTGSTTQHASGHEDSDFNLDTLDGFTSGLLFTVSLTTGLETLTPGQTIVSTVSSGNGSLNLTDTSVFAPYIGNGISTFGVPIFTLTSSGTTGGGGNIQTNFDTTGTAAANVIYTYGTSTGTPEPSTTLMIATGLLAVSFGLLRRKAR